MDPITIQLNVPEESCSTTIDVVPLGNHQYRIVDPCIALCTPAIGLNDVVEAVAGEDDQLIFQRVVHQAGYRKLEFILPQGWHERPDVRVVLSNTQEHGGGWEGVMGGILLIWIPPEATFDLTDDLLACFA